MLEDIIGDRTPKKIEELNDHIKNKYIRGSSNHSQYIFMQYSPVEWSDVFNQYTYDRHIRFLLSDIKEYTKIKLCVEVLNYKNHNDVHKYYPPYLIKVLNKVIEHKDNLDSIINKDGTLNDK